MPNELTIRRARLTDARAVAALIREAALSDKIKQVSRPDLVARVQRGIQTCLGDSGSTIFVVADRGENILAYAVIQWHLALFLPRPEGYISELTVGAAHRGRGIGEMLLNKVVKEGKNRNCARMSLINSRFRDSYKREFYSKRGWYEREMAANFIFEF
jgi:ribosomal protein S18 acetylase RimI-like enzyme